MSRPLPYVDHVGAYDHLLETMLTLRADVIEAAARRLAEQPTKHGAAEPGNSAHNLACYLALRGHDLSGLQRQLAALGLSSLGRGESHVLANLDQVIAWLERAAGHGAVMSSRHGLCAGDPGEEIISQRTEALFGTAPLPRHTRIMVTLPSAAAWDQQLVRELLQKGMDCARINCAHDGPDAWLGMISNVRKAAQALGQSCRIMMDLAGPKIRTGPLAHRAPVKHLHPARDDYGRPTSPCEILLLPDDAAPAAGTDEARVLRAPRGLLASVLPGDRLVFTDTRGKERSLKLVALRGEGWVCHCARTIYLSAGTELTLQRRRTGAVGYFTIDSFSLPEFPVEPVEIRLARGDRLRVTDQRIEGRPARLDPESGAELAPATVSCTFPGLLATLSPGQPVWFDDGKIGCVVETVADAEAILRVTEAGPGGTLLRADKGINFPGARFTVLPLSTQDRKDLAFVCRHADIVALSFLRAGADVEALLEALADEGAPDFPIVLKIETAEAVRNIADILLRVAGRRAAGIMIARGDLAVELGPVPLAETQEELLWLCEAAHLPVIWATQVLDTLAKKGLASRPEITDAAMGVRAECVMLNKGPRIIKAVTILSEILTRMQTHQHKKFPLLPARRW